jgi:ribA/ribD-fused uncharacterized protein
MVKVINSFSGEYRFLSNFWLVPVTYEGITYPSAEHAYQAAKSLDPVIREVFFMLDSPSEAKRMGQQIIVRPDWNEVRINVMRDIVTAKFEQNDHMMRLLMETKGYHLIEGNTWGDTFWGQSPIGNGRNELGKILMSIRDDITRLF